MGLHHAKIAINEHIQYEGQTQDNIPHGQGVLKVKADGLMNYEQSYCIKKPKSDKIQQSEFQNGLIEMKGSFNKGELVTCQAVIKGYKYVGEIKRGQFGGQGTLTHLKNGFVWQGSFQGGQLTKGKCTKVSQYECSGSFVEQKFSIRTLKGLSQKVQQQKIFEIFGPEGRFTWTSTKQSVEGTFEYSDLQGIGTYKYGNGDFYIGEFSNGYFKGQGKYTSAGNIFKSVVGTFYNSLVHSAEQSTLNSKNRVEFHNGDCYQGQFNNGEMHDKHGTYTFKNGMIYKGNIHFGKFSGQCEVKYPSSSQLEQYKGEMCDGALHGLGVLEYKNGVILKGYFSNNMKNGPCLLIYGRRTWKCLYLMDKLEGEVVEISKTK